MYNSNWIALNRRIRDNFLWDIKKPQYALAWIDLIMSVNYKDKKIFLDGKVVMVHRGSVVTSMLKLSKRWCMDRRTVKRYLDLLQNEGMITYTSTNKYTTINITKSDAAPGASMRHLWAAKTQIYKEVTN